MTKHELNQTVSGSERGVLEMEANRSKDSSEVHTGLSQITVFEQSFETSKPDNDGSEQETNHVWTSQEVEYLLKLYKSKEADLKDPRRKKKTIWNEICSEMRLNGFSVSPGQCECKMKNLKATYRRNLDRARAGDSVARCAFYDELYEIFGLSPHVRNFPNPTNTSDVMMNSRKRILPQPDANDVEEILTDDQQARQVAALPFKRPVPAADGIVQPADNDSQRHVEFIEELRMLRKALEQERQARDEERKKNEEERDRRAREFHEERMAMLNSMNKLISNLGSKE